MKKNVSRQNLKKKEVPDVYKIVLKVILIIVGIVLFLIYGIKFNGFNSLLFGLRESFSILTYILVAFILLIISAAALLGSYTVKKKDKYIYNGTTYDLVETTEYVSKSKAAQERDNDIFDSSAGCFGYGVIIIIGLFVLFVLLSLLDFLIPIIIGVLVLVLLYYLFTFIMFKVINRK